MIVKNVIAEAKRLARQGKTKLTYEEVLRIRQEGAVEVSEEIAARQHEAAMNSILGRCGILPIHKDCSIENYEVQNPGQNYARDFAAGYIKNFENNNGTCFVFSGTTGTGKNHLSAAICNELMANNFTCLIITVTELMIKMRKCYGPNPEYSEDEFIKQLINFDLLILDEVGIQKSTDHEKVIFNQIVDQRTGNLKPVGILTNLNSVDIMNFIGPRIFDRLKANNGHWIPFEWNSHR